MIKKALIIGSKVFKKDSDFDREYPNEEKYTFAIIAEDHSRVVGICSYRPSMVDLQTRKEKVAVFDFPYTDKFNLNDFYIESNVCIYDEGLADELLEKQIQESKKEDQQVLNQLDNSTKKIVEKLMGISEDPQVDREKIKKARLKRQELADGKTKKLKK